MTCIPCLEQELQDSSAQHRVVLVIHVADVLYIRDLVRCALWNSRGRSFDAVLDLARLFDVQSINHVS